MRTFFVASMFVSALALSACGDPSAEQEISRQTEVQMQEANAQVGPPAITNWAEKRLAKLILELRDNPRLQTFTYVKDMNGGYRLFCESVGFGLPYATQYTNPERYTKVLSQTWDRMAQPEPNGLYMPDSAEATWIICKDPRNGQPSVTYMEERATITQFPLPQSALAN